MTRDDGDFAKLWDLIKDIRFAMLTIQHGDGTLRARPMTTQNTRNDRAGTIWFFAARRGEPALDLTHSPVVNVSYADTGKDAYVSVSGRARIVEDMAKKREMWNTMAKAWFPGGVDDPELALIAVDIEHAEYWDVKSSHFMQLLKMTAAAAAGTRPNLKTEHGEIRH
jgi:general stress protein 26